VTLTLEDEIDVARGDLLVQPQAPAEFADQFAAHLVWMSTENLFPGRSYLMKINDCTLTAAVTELKHRIDVNTLAKLAVKSLGLNEVGVCNVSVARPVLFDAYADNRDSGAFILIDRYSNETVAAGMIDFALRRATNIHHHSYTVSKHGARTLCITENIGYAIYRKLYGPGWFESYFSGLPAIPPRRPCACRFDPSLSSYASSSPS
jgi:bifunctional enzyme CysN/CysC